MDGGITVMQNVEMATVTQMVGQATGALLYDSAQQMKPLIHSYVLDMIHQQKSYLDDGVVYDGVEFKGVGSVLHKDHPMLSEDRVEHTFEDLVVSALKAPADRKGDLARAAFNKSDFRVFDPKTGLLRCSTNINGRHAVNDLEERLQNVHFEDQNSREAVILNLSSIAHNLSEIVANDNRQRGAVLSDITPPTSASTSRVQKTSNQSPDPPDSPLFYQAPPPPSATLRICDGTMLDEEDLVK